jgi:gluconokinase
MSSVLDETLTAEMLAAPYARPESDAAVLLAIDIGSSGVRAALFDGNARELCCVRRNRRNRTANSTAHTAESYLAVVTDLIDELLSPVPLHVEIELIAISCFWHSLVGVDAAGSTTTLVLDWSETRPAKAASELRTRLSESEIHQRTGCRLHPSYWPAKLLWLRTEHADRFAATTHWLSLSEYLTQELFGETAASACMASATGLLNQHTCEWDQALLDALQISIEQLSRIAPDKITDVTLKKEYSSRWFQLRNARLCPAVGDGAANSIGSGCHTNDKLALMIGTSAAARVVFEGGPPAQIPTELWCYRVDRHRMIAGGALSDGGGLYHWLEQSILADWDTEYISERLSEMEADGHGLTVLPFWAGERSTGWSPNATGGILGLNMRTTPLEILRASMEAIAYRLALIVQALDSFITTSEIVASGNALQSSDVWVQIISDVIGRQITLSGSPEASTRGAALLALEAAGKMPLNENVIMKAQKVFVPDSSKHPKYQEALRRQQKFYDAVAPLFS